MQLHFYCTREVLVTGKNRLVLQEIYVILAKFAPQGSKNRKILGSDMR